MNPRATSSVALDPTRSAGTSRVQSGQRDRRVMTERSRDNGSTRGNRCVMTNPRFRARAAISAVFFINGAVFASWIAHIPGVKAQHHLSDGGLGLTLLSTAVGSVAALPVAAWLIARWGSRTMTSIAVLGCCLVLPLLVVSPNVAVLALVLAIFGALNGTLDVSMNAQAVALEARYRRPIMSAFHGLWSLGGVAGAAIASGAMALGVGTVAHVAG